MNTVSWLFYLADLSESISAIFAVGSAMILIIVICWWVVILNDSSFKNPPKYLYAIIVVFALIATFIPSKQTMYLIALSETTETFYQSELGQELIEGIIERMNSD